MSHRYFENQNQAYFYSKSRPVPSQQLISRVLSYLTEKVRPNKNGKWKVAVDVGAGSGQCTRLVQRYFDTVYGFDISEAQVNEAKNNNIFDNVEYKVSPSERLPIAGKSVDLITACQCLHWFDWEAFFGEAHRVLKPDGVLAVIGYPMRTIQLLQTSNQSIDSNILCDIYNGTTLHQYFDMSRLKHLENGYADIEFPFKELTRHSSFMDKHLTATDCIDYVQSWSGFQNCFEHDPFQATSLLQNLRNTFECSFKDPDLSKTELILRSISFGTVSDANKSLLSLISHSETTKEALFNKLLIFDFGNKLTANADRAFQMSKLIFVTTLKTPTF